eukprot:7404879-Pyramimonas_sp.AAC.1
MGDAVSDARDERMAALLTERDDLKAEAAEAEAESETLLLEAEELEDASTGKAIIADMERRVAAQVSRAQRGH